MTNFMCLLGRNSRSSQQNDFVFSALSQKRIGVKSMLGVYLVMIAGMVVAFMTLLAEIYWSNRNEV